MTGSKFKVCFISAPQGADTSILRQALDDHGIRWFDITTTKPGGSALDTVESGIAMADFVCGVIPSHLDYASVCVEIGIALGKGRPLLLFITPGLEVPTYFKNLAYVPVKLTDPDAINLQLDVFLKHARLGGRRIAKTSVKRTNRVDNNWALETWNRLRTNPGQSGSAFEGFVSDLFRRSGAVVSTAPPMEDRGADMAVWIDRFEPTIGNPLLVDVKYGDLSEGKLQQAEVQLRSYLTRKLGRAGLLVYGDKEGREFGSASRQWPLIVRLSIGELISLLGTGKFVETVLEQRNRVAHGIS